MSSDIHFLYSNYYDVFATYFFFTNIYVWWNRIRRKFKWPNNSKKKNIMHKINGKKYVANNIYKINFASFDCNRHHIIKYIKIKLRLMFLISSLSRSYFWLYICLWWSWNKIFCYAENVWQREKILLAFFCFCTKHVSLKLEWCIDRQRVILFYFFFHSGCCCFHLTSQFWNCRKA